MRRSGRPSVTASTSRQVFGSGTRIADTFISRRTAMGFGPRATTVTPRSASAKRTLEQRMLYAFIRTYKPVLDDAPFRAFDTMEEYRQWCEKNLPDWLGYGRI